MKWNALQVIPLPCAFQFIFSNVDATQAPTSIKLFDNHHESTLGLIFLEWYDPLHVIMWPYWFIDLNLTCSSPLPRSIGAKSLLKLPRHMRFVASKPPTCLSHLHPVHRRKVLSQSSPSSHMTPCHVSYAMSSLITLLGLYPYVATGNKNQITNNNLTALQF